MENVGRGPSESIAVGPGACLSVETHDATVEAGRENRVAHTVENRFETGPFDLALTQRRLFAGVQLGLDQRDRGALRQTRERVPRSLQRRARLAPSNHQRTPRLALAG